MKVCNSKRNIIKGIIKRTQDSFIGTFNTGLSGLAGIPLMTFNSIACSSTHGDWVPPSISLAYKLHPRLRSRGEVSIAVV